MWLVADFTKAIFYYTDILNEGGGIS